MPFTTENKNFQSQLNFDFKIHRLPHVNFNLQKANIPGVELGPVAVPTVLNKHYVPGDEITFNLLEVEFIVQEGMRDWFELRQWLVSLGFPDTFKRYQDVRRGRLKDLDGKPVKSSNLNPFQPKLGDLYSQISLFVLTSKENVYLEATFTNAFPISLSDLNFATTDNEIKYITATARFRYDTYDVKKP